MAYAAGWIGAPAPAERTGSSAISLVDNDGDSPLFSLGNMAPGQSASSCIALTNESDVPVEVALHAETTGTLAPFVQLQVERGTSPQPVARSCSGFSKLADVWAGRLSDFPAPAQAGVGDATLSAGDTRLYRYTATLASDDAAQGRQSSVTFSFSGTGEPPAEPAVEVPTTIVEPPRTTPGLVLLPTTPGQVCAGYHLDAGAVRMHTRLRKRGRASLVITKARGVLRVSPSVRNPRGRAIRARTWSRVSLSLNGKRVAVRKRRPFRVAFKRGAIRTGPNKLGLVVRPRRGRPTKAAFRVFVHRALLNGASTCVFRAERKGGVRREPGRRVKR